MGRLIEEEAVIKCLTNTAKYYEREDADEWTKGIHYGLLHGVDNILDDVPTVEAIPKADYENRLKADLVAMLDELDLELYEQYDDTDLIKVKHVRQAIQQKINSLKEA